MSVDLKFSLKFLNNFIVRFICTFVFIVYVPSVLYAQSESVAQPNKDKPAKVDEIENPSPFTRELIRANKAAAEEIDKAADIIDKNVSPKMAGAVGKNETQVYVILGGDFADNGDIESNFRYGVQLHLPRFERYWKVKFANQDEKRDRGQSSVTRQQRTRNTNDDVFLGVSFMKNWDRVEVQYKPQIAISDGIGLDHSIEADTEYEFGRFNFEPSLEFFANHDDGAGSSISLKFVYWLYKKMISFEQGNDARFLYLRNILAENHSAGFAYTPNDRFSVSTHYFRSFGNDIAGYMLSAYGGYITINSVIYKKVLSMEVKPYVVFEREENFKQINGALINFRLNF